jgi:8-oxo-dGTP pyrophosphatase MutT (NUDIX family)
VIRDSATISPSSSEARPTLIAEEICGPREGAEAETEAGESNEAACGGWGMSKAILSGCERRFGAPRKYLWRTLAAMSTSKPIIEHSSGGILLCRTDNVWRALLLRVRARDFEIPKGHLEVGESHQQAALRELREETALLSRAEVGTPLGELEYVFERGQQAIRKRVVYFRVLPAGVPAFGKKPEGTRELLWVSKEEARSVALVSESLRPLILLALED